MKKKKWGGWRYDVVMVENVKCESSGLGRMSHMTAPHSFHAKMWEIILGSDHLDECLDRTFLERVRLVHFNWLVWCLVNFRPPTFVTKAAAERASVADRKWEISRGLEVSLRAFVIPCS
jgi:hypothetical protein